MSKEQWVANYERILSSLEERVTGTPDGYLEALASRLADAETADELADQADELRQRRKEGLS